MRIVLALALLVSCGDKSEPAHESRLLLDSCGPAPVERDYPTLEAWRDDAVVWMACARFSCSTIVVDTGVGE